MNSLRTGADRRAVLFLPALCLAAATGQWSCDDGGVNGADGALAGTSGNQVDAAAGGSQNGSGGGNQAGATNAGGGFAGAGGQGAGGTSGAGGAAGSGGQPMFGGRGGSGGASGLVCLDAPCAGVCSGRGCDGAWSCNTQPVACTADVASFCGCDGKTFTGSGSCPNRAFAWRGACEDGVSCDLRRVLCRAATPVCPAGQVPSVEGTCYGACVKIDSCACTVAADCPDANQYTCHVGRKRCGPYLN